MSGDSSWSQEISSEQLRCWSMCAQPFFSSVHQSLHSFRNHKTLYMFNKHALLLQSDLKWLPVSRTATGISRSTHTRLFWGVFFSHAVNFNQHSNNTKSKTCSETHKRSETHIKKQKPINQTEKSPKHGKSSLHCINNDGFMWGGWFTVARHHTKNYVTM